MMGWWSKDILGGDFPLDCLGQIEDQLGVPDLYPLSHWSDAIRSAVRQSIQRVGYDALVAAVGALDDDPVGVQVVAVVAMAAGAPLTPEFKAQAIHAGEQDTWAREDIERGQEIADYLMAVEHYTDVPVVLHHTGLFERISTALTDS